MIHDRCYLIHTYYKKSGNKRANCSKCGNNASLLLFVSANDDNIHIKQSLCVFLIKVMEHTRQYTDMCVQLLYDR